MGAVRIGCSGWSYRDWRGPLYEPGLPQRRWLERYAAEFETVEINATFYRLPKLETVATWAREAPPGFCFAVKASRYLTHIRRLAGARESLELLYERIAPLARAGNLGPILWQLPPTFARDDERLEEALATMSTGRHAIEFRHPSWFTPAVFRRLRSHGVAVAVGDDPRRELPPAPPPTADFAYLRLHRGRRGRRGRYSPAELDAWAGTINRWRRRAEVFVYFNNDWEGFAVENARALQKLFPR